MAEELVRLTSQNDEMEEKVNEIPKLKVQLKVRDRNLEHSPFIHRLKRDSGVLGVNQGFPPNLSDYISGSGTEAQHHLADVRRKG